MNKMIIESKSRQIQKLSKNSPNSSALLRRDSRDMRLLQSTALLVLTFSFVLANTPQTPDRDSETYTEHLSIRQTPSGHLLTTFTFTTLLPRSSYEDQLPSEFSSYTLFPSALGEIIKKDGVEEMSMTLNSGKWDYGRWGYEGDVGSGGEVWGYFGGGEERCVLFVKF